MRVVMLMDICDFKEIKNIIVIDLITIKLKLIHYILNGLHYYKLH